MCSFSSNVLTFFSLPLPTLDDDLSVEVGRHLVAGRQFLEDLHAVHGGLDEEAEVAGARALGPHHGEGDGELGGADQVGLRAVLEPGTEKEKQRDWKTVGLGVNSAVSNVDSFSRNRRW